MTKNMIISKIAKRNGIDRITVKIVVDDFMDVVKADLINGKNVYLRRFGSFMIKHRKAKKARDLRRNTTIIIPAHNIPVFKPSKKFMQEVKDKTK